ncbi:MAG: Endonuclease/exonuclease/phosphatase, partial [Ilumatobacteraceae bacterium]|nr:Endonuclease/exonuclease/phosphatase [Ilumatobacteraceae bacterium]
MSSLRTLATAAFASIALAAATFAVGVPAHAIDTTSNVVISEVYGGGGNSGAVFTNDFIELYNTSGAPVSLDGWSVQYASATGTSWQTTLLTGTIPASGFYLVGEAAGSGGTTPLPGPDVVGTIPMSGSSGKVALVNGAAALTCAGACVSAPGVVDFVGYGTANEPPTGTVAPGLSSTTSDQRTLVPFANSGNNLADFTAGAPTPKSAPVGVPTGPDCTANPVPAACVPGPDTIQDIQGSGFVSPLDDQVVGNVAGIVTAVRTGSGGGFWIQQPTPDPARPSASSGLFVFGSSAVVAIGDSVLVSGTVNDFYPLSSGESLANTASLSITELGKVTAVTTISKANPLPATVVLGSDTVPDTFSPTVAGGNIETIDPLDPSRSAQEFFEAHEGMLVGIDNARVVGPGNTRFGEVYVTTKPAQQATPRGGTYIGGYDQLPSGRLLVAPVNGVVPAANVGDVLGGQTSGPVDWSTFGGYDIAATRVGSYEPHVLAGTSATAQAPDQLAIATYNVENLAPGDPTTKYERLAKGLIQNLATPDIVTVEEIQDNTGAADDGVVAADLTLQQLTDAIVAAGGPRYEWSQIDPVNDADGGQPGGNIRVVFLYNPARVTFVARPGGDSTTALSVSTGADHTAELSLSPGRVEPTDDAWTTSRKPLAGEFLFNGAKVIVVANHFNSKGGDQIAEGRFQPPTRSSEVQRTKQAVVLNTFVKQVLAADPDANIVLAGDFNDYQFSGPIMTLTDNGMTLTDLINTLPVNERYTYNFNGISQVLDHIFVSKPITDVQYDVIHINSEFAAQASDHDPQVARIRPAPKTQPAVTVD